MKKINQNHIIWAFRILVSGLFLLSAYSKLFPLESALYVFAKQIVDLGITNWCVAPLLARAIVGFEIFLGIAILQNNFLKSIIVPATFLLLLAFCIHLSWVIATTGNNGSCGCFGELIPMLPLEAIIKNLITMAMLVYIFLKVKPKEKDQLWLPLLIFAVIYLAIFIFQPPKCCCAGENNAPVQTVIADDSDSTTVVIKTDTVIENGKMIIKETQTTQVVNTNGSGRKKVNSIFTKYTSFNTGKVDLNSGKKIVCLFSLDCEHCQEASTYLHQLKKKNPDFPPVYVLAFGEESQVNDFFSAAGGRWPYTIVAPEEFFPLLGDAKYPPRIVVMDNGNFLGDFINFEHLDTDALMRAVKR